MYKANEVIGLPVLDLKEGQERGVVRDVLFDEDWTFQGLLVEVKALFRRGRFIPSEAIHAIGDDYVTISEVSALKPLKDCDHLNGMRTGPVKMMGKPVVTANGHHLGQVEDVYFQSELGTIVGYEISDGLLSDLVDGRKAVKHVLQTMVGEDAVIIPARIWQDQGNQIKVTEGEDGK